MIGLSISFCVAQIVRGKMPRERVAKIIAGTKADSQEAWDSVIERYRDIYWRGIEDDAEKLLREMLAEGKIEQPRLVSGQAPCLAFGYWVESENEIVFM